MMRTVKYVLVVLALCVYASPALAQVFGGRSGVKVKTVATLGQAKSGLLAQVTDGADDADCTVGGGSTIVLCMADGSIWAAVGGASAGTGGWADDGTVVRLATSTDQVVLGNQIQIEGGAPGSGKVLTSDVVGLATWVLPSAVGFTDVGNTVRLTNVNDKVGIGTSSPNTQLDVGGNPGAVVGGFASGQLHVTGQNVAVNANAVITGHNLFGGNKQLWYLGSSASGNDNIILINRQAGSLAFSTSNVIRMTIETGGDIGIGTSNPTSQLQVSTGSIATGATFALERVDASVMAGNSVGTIGFLGGEDGTPDQVASIVAQADVAWTTSNSGSRLLFSTTASGNTSDTERMRIDSSGNVGIGVASPVRSLHVRDVLRLEPTAAPPPTPGQGDIYNDSSGALCYYDGTSWSVLGGAGSCS